MRTTVSELPDSRVRVEVEVPAADVDRAVQRAARALAREMRMPGFRKGKAPPSLVIQRLGFGAVFEEAVREALPEWFERALLQERLAVIGDPRIEIVSAPEAEGEPLDFRFEIGVLPKAKLGEYKGLEVGRPESGPSDELVDQQIERMRHGFSRLEPVERPAAEGDVLLIDFEGTVEGEPFDGSSATDYMLELGGFAPDGFEAELAGASAGEKRRIEVDLPASYRIEQVAGKAAIFEVEVKEVREKILPQLDDDFASEASEFDSLEELRADIARETAEAMAQSAEEEFRAAAVDAAVEAARVELPDDLVTARATANWERFEQQVVARGMNPGAFLQMKGKAREEVVEDSKPEAELELKREAVLTAIADAEGIEVTEEELLETLAHAAEHERTTPEKLLARLSESGRDAMLRDEVRIRKAIDLVVETAKPIPVAQAEAREKIWTPEKEREAAGGLWTPGDDA